jgi:hypothetical protein
MKPYCIQIKEIADFHLQYLEVVKGEMKNYDDKLTCHEVCEKLSKTFYSLVWIKGKFNYFDHSWLIFRSDPKIILDAYPIAVGSGPILVSSTALCWSVLYRENL